MLIDTHCHVHFNAFKDDMDEVIKESLEADVAMITVGTQQATSQNAVKVAERYDRVWATVGLHPSHLFETQVDEQEVSFRSRNEIFEPEFYRELARHPKTVAIGEMGLDYYHRVEGVDPEEFKQKQAENYLAGVKLAQEEGLPIVTHCRDPKDAPGEALNDQLTLIEKAYGPYRKEDPPRGVAHCFSGGIAEAQRYFELGFFISVTGNITFKPKKADVEAGRTLQDVIKWAPLDKIMVETDAPYLAPVPHRGERCKPHYVHYVAEKIAEIKGVSPKEIEEVTTENACRLFKKMDL